MRHWAVALAVLLAGCGSNSTVDSTLAATTSTTATTSTSSTTPTTTTTLPPSTTLVPPPLTEISVELEPVVSGFDQAVFVTTRSGDSRLFIADQAGVVYAFDGEELITVLDIAGQVRYSGEQGFLGLAFHPTAPERMFVHYSDNNGDHVIAEYLLPAAGVAATPVQDILTPDHPDVNHLGGMIAFGPDGYFYIGLGDGGARGDYYRNAQNTFTVLGDILRLDVDSASPYSIPPDNPYADGVAGAPEVWVSGLRNPWRFSFDGEDIWIGDVGQNEWEEIHRITLADGGANLGWPIYEGTHCYDGPDGTDAPCPDSRFIPPVLDYSHFGGGCSVIGGYVYRGTAIPGLVGAYLFSDWCSGDVTAIRLDDTGAVVDEAIVIPTGSGVTSFGVDAAGEIYVTRNDTVYRLVAGG